VARGLEADWEQCLRALSAAEAELAQREKERRHKMTSEEKEKLRALSADLEKVWLAAAITDKERKQLLRTLREEVNIKKIEPQLQKGLLILRWKGGLITEVELDLKRRHVPALRTEEDTIQLIRRLAQYYPNPMIAGILNRQGRRTATGERFTGHRIHGLCTYWKIPMYEPTEHSDEDDLVTIDQAADILGIGASTLHRYLMDGFVAGEQLTAASPWRIRMTDELRARFADVEVTGYVSMKKAMSLLGVTRQTIMQRIKCGDLEAVVARHGKRKELRIKVPAESLAQSQQLAVFPD
jgi:predicted DNA-binding transcriptional regulator AlpA